MENHHQRPPAARGPAGSETAPARPRQIIMATIDLTDDCDYEPPTKFVIANNRDTLPKPQIDLTQPGTSFQQPSTSNQLPGLKQGPCMICGISPCNWTLKTLDCRHHFCKNCFGRAIKPQKDPLTMNVCPVPYCKTVIGDEVIQQSLPTVDYIFYLETLRDTLRGALGAGTKNNHQRPLEQILEEAELLEDIEQAGNGIGDGISVNLAEEPAHRGNISVNRGAAPKRRLSWLVQSSELENQPYFSNCELVRQHSASEEESCNYFEFISVRMPNLHSGDRSRRGSHVEELLALVLQRLY